MKHPTPYVDILKPITLSGMVSELSIGTISSFDKQRHDTSPNSVVCKDSDDPKVMTRRAEILVDNIIVLFFF